MHYGTHGGTEKELQLLGVDGFRLVVIVLGFVESIKACTKNKPSLVLEVSIFAMVIMQNTITGNLAFLLDYVIEFEMNALNVTLVVILAAIIGYSVCWVNKIVIVGAFLSVGGFAVLIVVALTQLPARTGFPSCTLSRPSHSSRSA